MEEWQSYNFLGIPPYIWYIYVLNEAFCLNSFCKINQDMPLAFFLFPITVPVVEIGFIFITIGITNMEVLLEVSEVQDQRYLLSHYTLRDLFSIIE